MRCLGGSYYAAASLAVCISMCLLSAVGAHAGQYIFLSDIHYDPYYGTSEAFGPCINNTFSIYGNKGCDAPLKLVTSTLEDITANYPNLPMILTGDWLRHDMKEVPNSQQDAVDAFATMTKLFANMPHVIPSPTLLTATLGNNDVVPDYYFDITNNNTSPHALLGNMTQAMTNNSLLSADEAATFSRCAMFSRTIDDLTFIVLNTLVWSRKLDPPINTTAVTDPCGQFAFLRTALQQTKAGGRKAVLLSHIPPTLNLFDVLVLAKDDEYLVSSYLDTYSSILQEFNATLAAQFYGHTHELSVFGDPLFPAPGFVIPAITPNYDNDPSYLIGTYDGYFKDVSQRYFDRSDATWKTLTPTIDTILGPFDTTASIRAAVIDMYFNDTNWDFFQQVHAGGIPHNIWPIDCTTMDCRKRVLCSMIEFRTVGFQNCIANPFPTATTTTTTTTSATTTTTTTTSTTTSTTPAPDDNDTRSAVSIVVVVLCVLSFIFGIGGLVLVGIRFRTLRDSDANDDEDVSLNRHREDPPSTSA